MISCPVGKEGERIDIASTVSASPAPRSRANGGVDAWYCRRAPLRTLGANRLSFVRVAATCARMLPAMAQHKDGCARGRSWVAPLAVGAALGVALVPRSSSAQTWTGGRTTPLLDEIVAIDRTGEPRWPYGDEDVAGDGETFDTPERSIDFRSAYAVAADGRFWVRGYVSETAAISGETTLFVFIDTDRNRQTGGTAATAGIDDRFTNDESPGGYEVVLGVKGDGTLVRVWSFAGASGR
jgi:hypothetical protein